MKLAHFVALGFAFIAFFGCSEKKYFEPSIISGEWSMTGALDDEIIQANKSGALLDNGAIVTKDGILDVKLPDGYLFLNAVDDVIIAASYETNTLYLLNKDGKELDSFVFEYMPLSANLKGDILALVLSNNSIMLWDRVVKEELFSNKNSIVYVVNSKQSSPLFLENEVVFPTLDGKLMFVDLGALRITKNITLGAGNAFNNVIYLTNSGANIIAATNTKIMTIIGGQDFSYSANIIDVLFKDEKIYALSLEGEVIELDLLLNELHKKKFRFASLSAIIVRDNIYTIESQGYLIKLNRDNFEDLVYEIDISEYKDSFYTDDTIYYDDEYIRFP